MLENDDRSNLHFPGDMCRFRHRVSSIPCDFPVTTLFVSGIFFDPVSIAQQRCALLCEQVAFLKPAQITETNLTEKFFTSFQIWMFARPKFRRRISIRSLAPSTIRRRTIVPQTGFAMRRMHPDISSDDRPDRRPSHRGRFKALVESFVNSANSVIEV